jgi:antitoxin component of MazEF toxin-antitoxin module
MSVVDLVLAKGAAAQLGAEIARRLGLTADETVMLVEGEDFVLVKRPPSAVPADRFEVLAERTQRRFEEEGVSGDDVERAIRWARDSS